MKYLPLLELSVAHEYFPDGVCQDYHIQPDPKTEQLLRNHRCLFKGHATGFVVLQTVGDDGEAFISMAPDTQMRFIFTLLNQDHLQYTDQKSLETPEMVVSKTSGKHTISFERGKSSLTALFALSGTLTPANDAPLRCTVTFKPRQAYWEFFFVTPQLPTDTHLFMQDASGDTPISFNRQEDNPSLIRDKLHTIYPDSQIHHFISELPMACQHQTRKSLQLLINNHCLIGSLPNPLLSNHNTIVHSPTSTATNTASFYELVHLSHLSIPSNTHKGDLKNG